MKKISTEEFIKRCTIIHKGKYDYSKTIYYGNKEPVLIICPIHGEFTLTRAGRHLEGCGCPTCGKIAGGKAKKDFSKVMEKRGIHFIEKAKLLNPTYDYSKVKYTGENNNVIIICPLHGEFKQTPHNHISNRNKCPKCNKLGSSQQEKEILKYLKEIYNGNIIENDREILNGKELDIFIPDLKIAIEYDGIYWHNNLNNYFKFEKCLDKGIRLIQITEWEWLYKNKQIKDYLSNILTKPNKIFARKCKIKEISNKEYMDFTNNYHLEGYCPASIRIGLFYNEELVQIMSFNKTKNYFEIIRECSKSGYLIVGGKSKLLKYFERIYSPKIIISYCEKNKFTGNSYIKCGFKLKEESEPSYCYYKNGRRIHKNDYKKEKINFDEDLSEWENMSNNGYMRLFDYGNYVFIKEY